MPLITVFTPTFNREYIIQNLYNSLKKQTYKDFEWVVIDDGSFDNTKSLFNKFLSDKNRDFDITYVYKENGGKPRAINDGLEIAKGRYFFMVDSDDYLLDDAIEKIVKWIKEIDDIQNIVGVGAAKGFPNHEYIKGVSPRVNSYGYVDATNLERHKYDLDADMCEAYKTDILRKYPFKVWPEENFAPEEMTLNDMALDGYKIRWHSDIIYICDYLDDGLTKGAFNLLKKNPMGYAMLYNHKLKYSEGFKEKIYNSTQMIALSLIGKNANYILKSNSLLYTLLSIPLGIIIYFRRKGQFKDD